MTEETTTTIMAALATLTQSQLSDLTASISSDVHLHRRRLSAVLSSPHLFSLTLQRLRLLSLPDKTLLIAKHLLSSLHHLTLHYNKCHSAVLKPRDLDAVLVLLLLCDVRQHSPEALETPPFRWREVLGSVYARGMLSTAGYGIGSAAALLPYIETAARCLRFVGNYNVNSNSTVVGRETAATVAAVVALPSVGGGGGEECVICREEMREGRDVCGLPCQHKFHWRCVLPWLRRRNTCPCCRFRLPTDDVFGEIQRLWDIVVKMSGVGKELIS
ncbi:E3 ubiquitin-protein ligase RING1-like protein [Morus notabilis]|uniref:E3 ubiquitin-protein ligase RING1-like protein n=2 Tax=Morus notabilis TaxID=981085 RepID=W9QY87_9ROSA|nr:E3 ubiquitin-protein ligase RING1-like protein [Morus notabilis]